MFDSYKLKDPSDVCFQRKEGDLQDFYLLENIPDKETLNQKYVLDPIKILNGSRKQEIANYLSLLLDAPHTLEDVIEEGELEPVQDPVEDVIEEGIVDNGGFLLTDEEHAFLRENPGKILVKGDCYIFNCTNWRPTTPIII